MAAMRRKRERRRMTQGQAWRWITFPKNHLSHHSPLLVLKNLVIKVAELQLTDWGSLACLLCARQFQTREKLQKHNTMSDLHTKNLEEWRSRRGKDLGGKSQYQDQQDQTYQYKDRAKERRKKFGKEELPPENKFKDKYMAAMADVAASGAPTGADAPKLDDSNLGNR